MNQVSQRKYYPLLDIAQFVASLFVILIHSGRLVESDVLHFFLKSLLCRIAVPLFLICSGYFYRLRQGERPHYQRTYLLRQVKRYTFWTLFYLPYGWFFLASCRPPSLWYFIALVAAFLTIGICYHLWYFPALLTGLWLSEIALKKGGYPLALFSASTLYILGASETYSSFLTGKFALVYHTYRALFATTRNGLFYAFIFVLLGFFLADFKETSFVSNHLALKFNLSFLLLLGEGWLVYHNQGDDKNFLFSLIPLTFFLVSYLIHPKMKQDYQWPQLRFLSQALFLLHPMVLEWIKVGSNRLGYSIQGLPLFAATFVLTSLAGKLWAFQIHKGASYL